jgi:glycosyltransferase involved in cell wall biosynthesis
MSKIKVVQITHDLNIGGLQRVVLDIAKNLDKDRFEVKVISLRDDGPLKQELMDARIPVYSIKREHHKTDYLSFMKVYKLLKELTPHVIHTHNTEPFVDGGIAGFLARVPAKVHTDHARDFPDKKRYMFAEWTMSHIVDRVVAVSEHTKQNLVTFEKMSPRKIDVIRNGIEGQKYAVEIDKQAKMKELGIENKYPILGLGVRLVPQKGITYLIQAISKLKPQFPNICALIAGEGPLQTILEKEAQDLGVTNNIHFIGPRLDMPEILSLLDVYVLPSLWEGLPLVILEAMAAQKPIVVTDVGGVSEVIQNNDNGILIPSMRPDILTQELKSLLEDENKMKRIASHAKKTFDEKYSVAVMAQQYMDLYTRLL